MNKKNLKARTVTLISLTILLILNSIFLFSYYFFYVSDKLANDLIAAKNKNYTHIYHITTGIKGKNLPDSIDVIESYVKKHGGYVTLKDENKNILFTNNSDKRKLFSSSAIIYINDNEYELSYSIISMTPGVKIIRSFIIYELILITTIVIIAFFISSKKVMTPMEIITKDINNYKIGIRPMKRDMPKNMEQIQNAFVDLVDDLEAQKDYQNQIIASISHDIKTPLTSVIGYADRLKNNNLTEERKKIYMNKIYNKALLIKDILEEFDDYQSCNLKETMKFKEVIINDMCDYIKNDFETELSDKNIELIINNNCNGKKLLVDRVKMRRVVGNIINNSVTNFNGRKGKIVINIYSKNNKVYFDIGDNGGGIKDEKILKRIFEPLFTSDPSRKISGLGLSICKQIISAHDGNITAKNNDFGGLSIIFMLPKCKN